MLLAVIAAGAGTTLMSVGTAFGYWASTDSAHAAAATGATLTAPTSGAHGTATPSTIPISWTAPSGYTPTGYTVLRCSGTSCTPVTVTSGGCRSSAIGTATSCTDNDPALIAGTTYTYKITALLDNWTSAASAAFQAATASVTPTTLTFTTQPAASSTITAGSTFPVSVAIQDGSGNTATNDNSDTVTLAVGTGPSGSGLSCTNAGGLTVTVSAGVANYTGCSITKAGTYTLTASSSHIPSLSAPGNANSFTIVAGSASQLAFTTTAFTGPTSATTNLGPMTVQLRDTFGNPVSTGITVNLSSSSSGAHEFSTTLGGSTVTSVVIPSGSSTATFYYGDQAVGTPTVTASATGVSSATQVETIITEKLKITSSAISGTATNSPTLGPITVQLQDGSGNPVNAGTGGLTVNLSSNSTGINEFSATSGGSTVTSVVIPSGSSSVTFFYGDEKAGTPTITASATAVTSATQVETIKAGPAAGLGFSNVQTASNNGTVTPAVTCTGTVGSSSFACTISPEVASGNSRTMTGNVTLIDQFQNAVTNTSGSAITVALTQTGGSGVSPSSLSIANGASTSAGIFTESLANGSTQGIMTATATVSSTTVHAQITS